MKSCRSRARQAKILGRVAGAEPAKPKICEELSSDSPELHADKMARQMKLSARKIMSLVNAKV